MSNWGCDALSPEGVGSDVLVDVDVDVGVNGDEGASTSSRVVFRYLNFPLRRCASTVGSMRACSRATWISIVEGSMAVIEAARVAVGAAADGSSGIVRASDSAKIPPPQPMSM